MESIAAHRDERRAATERGKTFIADDVVSVIARIAAEQVEGIHRIGEPSLRNLIAGLGRGPGVAAEVGMQEAAADIEVVVEYGCDLEETAKHLRERLAAELKKMANREVVEVNINVVDVHLPEPSAPPKPKAEPRVR